MLYFNNLKFKDLKTKEKIKTILEQWEMTRDCDYRLYHKFLETFHYEYYLDVTLKDWLFLLANGSKDNNYIPCLSIVMRVRRQLQEKNPDLRGDKYYKRKEKLQNEALVSLGYEPKTLPDAAGMTP